MNFDYTLYLVTDRQLMSCDSLTEAVEQAILGGCTMIQLREKELSSLEFYNQAVAVKQVTDKYHIPLIINDRIDIAMAVQATGVHIGQHDLPAAAVRKVIGETCPRSCYGWRSLSAYYQGQIYDRRQRLHLPKMDWCRKQSS